MLEHSLSILHVCQPPDGGAAVVVRNLAVHQSALGYDVSVACPGDSRLSAELREHAVAFHDWNAVRDPTPRAVFPEAAALRAIIDRAAPDVVHLHSSKAGLVGRGVLRGHRTTVFQPHGWSFYAVDGQARHATVVWERRAASWSHATVCVSDDERRAAREVGVPGVLAVIPNGIDTERFATAATFDQQVLRRSLRIDDRPTVVCLGRLCRQKGQDLLLDLWPAVTRSVPNAQLVLVGDGPERAAFEATGPPGVVFAGQTERVVEYLAVADMVAMPSRWEGGSLTLIEAMAAGRSVVAFDVGGAADAMRGTGCAAIAPGDTRALLAAIIERLQDRERCRCEGLVLQRRARERYDVAQSMAAYPTLYETLLTSRTSSAPPLRQAVGF